MFKDLSMRIFLGHLVAYVAVTAICAGVNLWLTPGTLWWPWVLIGWGVAVATHAFALLLRKTHRRERIFIDARRAPSPCISSPMWRWCSCCSSSTSP